MHILGLDLTKSYFHLGIFGLLLSLMACQNEAIETEAKSPADLILMGTLHFPTDSVNADTLRHYLSRLKPDCILMEADSSKFDSAFNLVVSYEENEYLAVARYKKENPEVALRPFEFEGRDSYRQEHGLSTSPGPAFDILQELAAQGLYTVEEQKIWDSFVAYYTQIMRLSKQNLKAFNTQEADALNDSLWRYQYLEIQKIIDAHPEFEALMADTRGDSVSIRQHFADWAQFDYYDRNNAMVANIRAVMKSMPEAKRFVLLTGFQHRHYLRKELVKQGLESQLIEFYQIKPQSTPPTQS